MSSEHIYRDYSPLKKDISRPLNEYSKVEIHSFEPKQTSSYNFIANNFDKKNAKETKWKSWKALTSNNGTTRFEVHHQYIVEEYGEIRCDVIYSCKTQSEYTGFFEVWQDGELITSEEVVFDGDEEYLKRKTWFTHLQKGKYLIKVRLPFNGLWLGTIIRQVKTFYGDNIDSKGSKLQVRSVSTSRTSAVGGTDASVVIGYSQLFDCPQNTTGLYFDYRDELNIYMNDEDSKLKQVFGGYISSATLDTNRTKITINAGDRLIDGNKRYILESMVLLSGNSEEQHFPWLLQDFKSYGEALEYLCRCYEISLNNNIDENYLVAGENYEVGFAATLGSEGNIPSFPYENIDVETNTNFVTLRNHPEGTISQYAYLYNVQNYQADPVDITDFPNFYLTYGLQDPVQTTNSTNTVSGSFDKFGVSADGKQLMAIGMASANGEVNKYGYGDDHLYMSVFENKCPYCGANELVWGIWWGGYHKTGGTFPQAIDGRPHRYIYGKYKTGGYEGHIFCANCDADFSCIEGKDHTSRPVYINRISGPTHVSVDEVYKLQGGNGASGSSNNQASIGYDKSKPYQCAIYFEFAVEPGKNPDKLYTMAIDFTRQSRLENSFPGLTPVMINNAVRQSECDVVELMRYVTGERGEEPIGVEYRYYLHKVHLITEPTPQPLYGTQSEGQTTVSAENDNASCKLDVYGFGFNNGTLINPTDLASCGKTISSQMDTLIKTSGYLADVSYGYHRKDDIINFSVDNQSKPAFTIHDGDTTNIVSWSSINYNPINDLFNNSILVYKTTNNETGITDYKYANSRNVDSVLKYGELSTLTTKSETLNDKEAYYYARNADKYNADEKYGYTITVAGLPPVTIGSLVKVLSTQKQLNDLKKVQSIKITYDIAKAPHIKTELGLDELAPDLRLKKQLKELRDNTKKESVFSETATHTDRDIYVWER